MMDGAQEAVMEWLPRELREHAGATEAQENV
jgi:hypothetical protein